MPSDTIKVNVKGYDMEVSFDYHKAHKGLRERGTGFQLEPDEDAGICDITGIKLCNPADMLEIIAEEVTISMDEVLEAVHNYRGDDE